MELYGTERFGLVSDALIGAVVHVDKPWLPIASECGVVNCISMVLRCDEASVRADHAYRLVMASVTVFQLICRSSCCPCHQLVSHADAENRLVLLHCDTQIVYCLLAEFRVSRAVGNEKSVIVE